MNKLKLKKLKVNIEEKEILKGIDFTFQSGKIYALIGPNGNGKSTLFSSIMGHPDFVITGGDILLNDQSIIEMEADQRARKGIFLGMQQPPTIEGVSNINFLNAASNALSKNKESVMKTLTRVNNFANELNFPRELINRNVNSGFSGGEKKKNEILQMLMFSPKVILLDEIDSGLDIDSIEMIGKQIKELAKDKMLIRRKVRQPHWCYLYSRQEPFFRSRSG
ncbi:MAG: Fe-S cluster assembly ATPase SufC, partial [Mycoplasmataceae bacterium]|nr:Fe-S cluster assembly ATPase SufC [Mycoplasmataceae bacterium]